MHTKLRTRALIRLVRAKDLSLATPSLALHPLGYLLYGPQGCKQKNSKSNRLSRPILALLLTYLGNGDTASDISR